MIHPDWKRIVRHAWSFRLNILAGIFSFAEFMLVYLNEWFDIPRGVFAMLSLLVIIFSNITKIISQKEFRDGK